MFNSLKLFIVITISIFLSGCANDSESIIPDVRFNAQINLLDPAYMQSNSFTVKYDSHGNTIGIYGVVIYRSGNEYFVFDQMCPNDKDLGCLVKIDADNDFTCTCPCCNSRYQIASEYGGIIEGPTKWPLKKYNSSVSGNVLNIWN